MRNIQYNDFTDYITATTSHAKVRYIESEGSYYIHLSDKGVEISTEISPRQTADITDFETNFKPLANQSIYTVVEALPAPAGFSFEGNRTHVGSATNETITVDYTVPAERYLTGVMVKGFGTHWEDLATFSIVMPAAHAGNPTENEITVNTFAPTWAISDDLQHLDIYRAKVPAGMLIRVEYTTSSTTAVNFWVNTFLHERT